MKIESIQNEMVRGYSPLSSADQLEQAFLEEMLKYCGPTETQGEFSGGAGEEQFYSFLSREHAGVLAARLDLGFEAILEKRA